ncbi:hypothetical protein B7494_g3415 [Chlorociboria aeruginascens]|nr:hypothetical protein B7494_g3415 [Chlorociboria aeruginascens]
MLVKLLARALFLAWGVLALPTNISTTPDPSEVFIKGIVYGGTGCPQGSLGSFISSDRQSFTLIFDQYVASIGPGIAITENRQNCQLNIDLQYPSGFQYSVFSTIYRGFVDLDPGVSATQGSVFYFTSGTSQCQTSTSFKGPVSGDYEVEDNLGLTSVIWSPCGSNPLPLNVDSSILLNSATATGTGEITDDSTDGKITFVVGVQWQTC